ncbi:MAG: hypothetical protein E3J71_07040 [Candidatus Stahlbacteria bacterium]|nr:MAG: hypothetical protein E3J71_07040 [Candidatus Stahlbacteria bacterium]
MAEVSFPSATEEQINEGKSLAWLSYIWWLCIIPIVTQKENPFSMYHARQGLMLAIAETVIGAAGVILGVIIFWITVWFSGPVCAWIWGGLVGLVMFALAILALIGLIQALSGKFWKMPILGDLAEKWFKGMV